MEFIDLKAQQNIIKDEINRNIEKVLEHGIYIMGPEVKELEEKLAAYVGVKYCVSCASGTDALLMVLMAWGIGKGDAVFTTPFSFIATAEVIKLVGATPVFVDVDSDTFNLNPEQLENQINRIKEDGVLNAKAVIPVDIFGLPADYDRIQEICLKHDILLLADAAQGFGGEYKNKKVGSFGNATSTSFFPAKPLGCYGDGGAIFVNDDDLLSILKSIRIHGKGLDKYDNVRLGINGRLDTIQAAILLAKLEIFDHELMIKRKIANKYNELLEGVVKTPQSLTGYNSAYAQYSVLANNAEHRNIIIGELSKNNIPAFIYYKKPLHLQRVLDYLGYKQGDMPVTESICERVFSIPMHAYLKDEEIKKIADIIVKVR